jgi:phosphate transport system protein
VERHFDELLGELKRLLLKMSALAESMLAASIRLLADRAPDVIRAIREHEEQVDRLQVEVDEACFRLIALHQPTAGDLRFILGAAKTNGELERLADQAINICNKGEDLLQMPAAPCPALLPRMAALAGQMLKDSLHAYVNRDIPKARSVCARDDELDAMKRTVSEELIGLMAGDPSSVRRGLALALIARNLERIGDHATNIAENAVFVAEGTDIRHGG